MKKGNLPKRGPGIWYVIHSLSIEIENEYELEIFKQTLMNIFDTLPCPECKKHANEYYKKNPIDRSLLDLHIEGNYKYDFSIGVFRWTWMFHNFVNQQLEKDLLEFDTALSLYIVHNPNYEFFENENLFEDSCDSCSI